MYIMNVKWGGGGLCIPENQDDLLTERAMAGLVLRLWDDASLNMDVRTARSCAAGTEFGPGRAWDALMSAFREGEKLDILVYVNWYFSFSF